MDVKAHNNISFMNKDIFVGLGGFYQLMFLRLIGCLLEGSGLSTVSENIYTLITVTHMLTGKSIARAVPGHILCAAVLTSLL